MKTESSSIPASLLRQYCFCPRIPFFTYVRQLHPPRAPWVEAGVAMHQRIEQLLKRRDLTKLTSGRSYRLKTEVPLYSPDVPFHGICDAVLELEDGTYIPLEIKSGNASPHTGEIIQLCAYAVLLEQLHGGRIDIGFILYETKSKHKEILFTDAVRRKLDFCVEAIQRDAAKALVPQTSASDAQCTQCEFMNFCADRL